MAILLTVAEERRRIRAAEKVLTLKELRKFAANIGVSIKSTRDDVGWSYWLENTGWEDDNFCTDRREVYNKLCQISRGKGQLGR